MCDFAEEGVTFDTAGDNQYALQFPQGPQKYVKPIFTTRYVSYYGQC